MKLRGENRMKRRKTNRRSSRFAALFICGALGAGCAGSSSGSYQDTNSTADAVQTQAEKAAKLVNAKINFHYSDFYSLTSPSSTGCAGDIKRLYDPFATESHSYGIMPAPFPADLIDPAATILPAFIKNIAVDLTDANSTSKQNNANSCSFGSTENVAPASNCATFDYGGIGGLSADMGGALLLIGGVSGRNLADVPAGSASSVSCGWVGSPSLGTSCPTSAYALAIDTLPAFSATNPPNALVPGLTSATGAISTWANLAGSDDYTGPTGLAGAAGAFSVGARQAIFMGGSAPYPGVTAPPPGRTTSDTWTFDAKTQKWQVISASTTAVPPAQLTLLDTNAATTQNLAKYPGGRASFGYVAAPGMALQSMSTGVLGVTSRDRTDRIMITGGLAGAPLTDVHRFNPTYGPDLVDVADLGVAGATPVQWLDSYHTQLTSNSASGLYKPRGKTSVGFGMTYVQNLSDNLKSGYLLTAGGFDPSTSKNTPAGGCTLDSCGGMMLLLKNGGKDAVESNPSVFVGAPNRPTSGAAMSPGDWHDIVEGGGNNVPWYGGSHLLPGFKLDSNEVVYFGGADCQDYWKANPISCNFTNPGFMWQFGSVPHTPGDVADALKTTDVTVKAITAAANQKPIAAGMAATRGQDPAGKPIIVAWGGVGTTTGTAGASAPSVPTNADKWVYYLYHDGAGGTWVRQVLTASVAPPVVVDGSLVYSHVTRKYYLFGGYNPVDKRYSNDVWQLSITSSGNSACTVADSCTFTWSKLTVAGGTTCYPTCPTPRRAHRMVEADFNRPDVIATGPAVPTSDPACTEDKPCSYGLFMEGGEENGSRPTDRWMFDPTANNGWGHWQQMGELPPRSLAATTAVDYGTYGSANSTVHRAILFGGETSLHSPDQAAAAEDGSRRYFVAPTLGDTLMYDFNTKKWNRVTLLGKGYKAIDTWNDQKTYDSDAWAGVPEFERRQAYRIGARTQMSVLSPPALSGAVMVTRTMNGPATGGASPSKLKVPEVYLIGGRLKSGAFNSFDKVYKFCAGTTGEATALDSAECDAFDENTNPDSTSPVSDYVGRWLLKEPEGVGVLSTDMSSFMGAGAYDSYHDRVVVVGGKSFTVNTAITEESNVTGWTEVFEYTPATRSQYDHVASPPDSAELNGSWAAIPICSATPAQPAARYGHSLAFDPQRKRLIMVGGYAATGADKGKPLDQTVTYYDGTTYSVPEVWTGTRIDSNAAEDTINGIPAIADAPCYYWKKVQIFGNSIHTHSQIPPATLSHAASVYIPTSGFNTGYYSTFDKACEGQGPIASSDPLFTKLLAGGAYIDIDRSALGPNENLLLNLTFLPLGPSDLYPDSTRLTESDAALFKIHLIRVGQSMEMLRRLPQPRFMNYASTEQFPQLASSISVFAAPFGQVRQEQILLPLAVDPSIDRIRIERHSGTAILIDATIYRMGYK